MPQTPLTSPYSYAQPSDMVDRYDVRTLGELLDDTDHPLDLAGVLTSPKLVAILTSTAGEIESALVAGRRYEPDDLNALTGNALAYVVDLNCVLAMGRLLARRPDRFDPPAEVTAARETLQMLRDGLRIIPTEESAEAGYRNNRIAPSAPGRELITDIAARYLGPLYRPGQRSPF